MKKFLLSLLLLPALVLGESPPLISVTAPLVKTNNNISMPAATGSVNGYLTSANFNTFNGKLTSPLTTKGDILSYSSTNARFPIGSHTNGQVLTVNSSATFGFDWADASGGGVSTVGTYDSQAAAANGATISGSSIYFQSGDATHPGMVSNTTQTLSGNKTFTGSVIVNPGPLLVGTTSVIQSGNNEGFSDLFTPPDLTSANSSAARARWYADSAVASSKSQRGFIADAYRKNSAASGVTDTGILAGLSSTVTIDFLAGQTYTNTNATGVASYYVQALTNTNAATLAIDRYSGILVQTDAGATGTRKSGLNFVGISGSTNNAYIADNWTYSGDYFINSTSTNPSLLSGTLTVANVIDSGLTASQAVVTDGSKQLSSLAYASANTASALVQRDGSGNFSAGTVSVSGLNDSGLTASQAVVTDGSKNLASLGYGSTNTVSTLVERDSSGNFSAGVGSYTGLNVSGLTASQAVVTDGSKNLASLAYASANTASTLVQRDGSGNFSAGTITASLTGTASGNTTYTPNNHGVVVSGSGNAMTVIAPDSSTTKVLTSGGASADPSWQVIPTSVTTVGAFSGSSQTNGASISGSTITFGPADASNPGMVTTGSQTMAGAKIFSTSLSTPQMAIGDTTISSSALLTFQTTQAAAIRTAISVQPIFTGASSATLNGLLVQPSTNGGGIAMTTLNGISSAPAVTSTDTVTRVNAYKLTVPSTGTNNAGITDNNAYTGNYFINSTNTNPSALAGVLTVSNTTAASSTSSGAVITTGGIGVAKAGYFGDLVSAVNFVQSGTTTNTLTGLTTDTFTQSGSTSTQLLYLTLNPSSAAATGNLNSINIDSDINGTRTSATSVEVIKIRNYTAGTGTNTSIESYTSPQNDSQQSVGTGLGAIFRVGSYRNETGVIGQADAFSNVSSPGTFTGVLGKASVEHGNNFGVCAYLESTTAGGRTCPVTGQYPLAVSNTNASGVNGLAGFFNNTTLKARVELLGGYTIISAANPSAAAGQVTIGANLSTGSNTTLSIATAETVATETAATGGHSLKVLINGTEYQLLMK